jgi:hypothetical protein
MMQDTCVPPLHSPPLLRWHWLSWLPLCALAAAFLGTSVF